jgi:hypothetical protein
LKGKTFHKCQPRSVTDDGCGTPPSQANLDNSQNIKISPWTLNGVYNRSFIFNRYVGWQHSRMMESLKDRGAIPPNFKLPPTLSQVQGFKALFNQQVESQLKEIREPPKPTNTTPQSKWKEAEARWALLGQLPTKHLAHANEQQREHLLWLLKHVRSLFPENTQIKAWKDTYVAARVIRETDKCKQLMRRHQTLTPAPTETQRTKWDAWSNLIEQVVKLFT